MPKILNKRGTRTQINSAATANGLNAGEVYLITDENRIAIGLTISTYESFAKLNANTFTGTQTFSGTSTTLAAIFNNAAETTTVSATAAIGTIAYYTASQSVMYYTTNASANWTLNLRHSVGTTLNTAMAVGQTVTVTFMVTQGTTAFYNNIVQVDGTTIGVTTKWQGGSAPTSGNGSSIDVYTYAIIKTAAATFTVLAAVTKFA
jgi:hypothetical protein